MIPITNQVKEASLYQADVLDLYADFPSPTLIISDGPYGVSGFPGDLPSVKGLDAWYEPHIQAWTQKATYRTSLCFWNTEQGWAAVHPILEKHGWKYRQLCIWDKGLKHIAGNSNTQTLRSFPVVTEVCAIYVKPEEFLVSGHNSLRLEWLRTGMPLSKANEACGYKNVATRKYLTEDHLFYPPPPEILQKLIDYANTHGNPSGKPYFQQQAENLKIDRLRSVFKCPMGVTNVWSDGSFAKGERLKVGAKALHYNQKPLKLIRRLVETMTEPQDAVWDPYGGIFSVAVCCNQLNRRCFSAEINPKVYQQGVERLKNVGT